MNTVDPVMQPQAHDAPAPTKSAHGGHAVVTLGAALYGRSREIARAVDGVPPRGRRWRRTGRALGPGRHRQDHAGAPDARAARPAARLLHQRQIRSAAARRAVQRHRRGAARPGAPGAHREPGRRRAPGAMRSSPRSVATAASSPRWCRRSNASSVRSRHWRRSNPTNRRIVSIMSSSAFCRCSAARTGRWSCSSTTCSGRTRPACGC